MTKSIRVSDDLHDEIDAHNRDGETFSETLERLVGGPSLRELAGVLDDREAEEFRAAIEASHEEHDREIDRMLDDFE